MLKDFISFDKMVTPSIIKILFWIGMAVTILGGFFTIIGGITARADGGIIVLSGLVSLILGPLCVRVWCELLIVIFKIHQNLVEINGKGKNESQETEIESGIDVDIE